MEQAIGSK